MQHRCIAKLNIVLKIHLISPMVRLNPILKYINRNITHTIKFNYIKTQSGFIVALVSAPRNGSSVLTIAINLFPSYSLILRIIINMLSVFLRRSMPKFAAAPKKFAFRAFSEKLSIPIDVEQQHGRRKEEMDAEAAGEVGFERDPIVPPDNAGTKENPILVSLF